MWIVVRALAFTAETIEKLSRIARVAIDVPPMTRQKLIFTLSTCRYALPCTLSL